MAESKKADPKQILGSKLFFVTHFWPQFFFNPNFSLDTNLQLQLNWVIVNFSNTTQGVISTVSWKKGQNGPPPCQRMSDFCWPSSPLVSRCQHCSPPPPHIPKGGIKCFTQKSKYFLIMSKIRMIWTSSHNFLWNANPLPYLSLNVRFLQSTHSPCHKLAYFINEQPRTKEKNK